jgi:DNA end-binding protein Ku
VVYPLHRRAKSNHTIEIDSFVPRSQIDERFLDAAYYITPNDQVGQEAFAVIREAMRGKGMAALGRVVLGKRERVIMLQAWKKGLVGTTLRYGYEVRPANEYFDDIPDIKVPGDMLKLAEDILESKAAEFDPTQFIDHYEDAIITMLRQKQAGLPAPKERPAPAPANVVNLMDALRRSIAAEEKSPAAKKPKNWIEGQRELLLPIAREEGEGRAGEGGKAGCAPESRLTRPADPSRDPASWHRSTVCACSNVRSIS